MPEPIKVFLSYSSQDVEITQKIFCLGEKRISPLDGCKHLAK
jgi:hypothetical protein